MAQATEQQIKDLEKALTQQFFNLVQGARFRINLARLGDPTKPLSANEQFVNYSNVLQTLVDSWLRRETKYEVQLLKHGIKGLVSSGDLKRNDFFYAESLPKLDMLVKKYDAQKGIQGIGFIPLLIWAVIAISGFFTAKEIADDFTTTTQEKEQLMTTTAQTCKELGLSPEQCNAMISQTQSEAGSGGGLLDKLLLFGAIVLGGIFIVPNLISSK